MSALVGGVVRSPRGDTPHRILMEELGISHRLEQKLPYVISSYYDEEPYSYSPSPTIEKVYLKPQRIVNISYKEEFRHETRYWGDLLDELEEFKKVMECPLEELPLYINSGWDKHIQERLKEGK